jgi:colicin import membrane protein
MDDTTTTTTTDDVRYAVPKEPRRWRAVILAGGLHVLLLGALWVGARGTSDAHVPSAAQQVAPAVPAAVVKDIAKMPAVASKAAHVAKPVAVSEQADNKKLVEQKRRAVVAELKRKEEQQRLEKQKAVASLRAKEKKVALAKETQKKEVLAKKNAADKARKLAADTSLREKLRKEEMRRIAGSSGQGGKG